MGTYKKAALLMGTVAVLGLSLSSPVQAQTLLERLFPAVFKKDISDAVPLQGGKVAPFQNSAPVLQGEHMGEAYQAGDASAPGAPVAGRVEYAPQSDIPNTIVLDQPHRQPGQITVWVSKAISDALDFDPLRYDAHLQDQGGIMTPYAQEAFKAFMAKDNLLSALQSNDLVMRAFVTDASRVLNQGAIQGRYRWLLETPVTISFMPRGVSDYSTIKPKSQRINVRTQVGRVEQTGQGSNQEGVMIETIEFLPVANP